MKKMHLATVFIIITVIILSVSFISAGAETTESDEIRSIKILNELSLFDFPVNKREQTMTRREFAEALAKLLAYDKTPLSDVGIQQFSDITPEDKNASEIYSLKASGIMNGTGDGKFSPQENITQIQAVKSVIIALDYNTLALSEGGYPRGYMAAALKIGLLNGIGAGEAPLTIGQCAKLFMNAAETDIPEITVSEGRYVYNITEGKNLLWVFHSIVKSEKTVMTDNGISSLEGKSSIGTDNVCIDGIVMKSAKGAKGYLGEKINCYYYSDGSGAELLYAESCFGDSSVVVHAKDLIYDGVKKTQIKYQDKKAVVTKNISPYAACIYNGVAYPDFNGDTLKIKSGTVKLISTDYNNNNYDLVIIDEYDICLFDNVSAEGEHIYDKYGNNIDLTAFDNIEITDTEGNKLETKNLKRGNLISVFKSKDKSTIRLVVSTAMTEGKIEVIDKTTGEYTIGENTYFISGALNSLIKEGYGNLKAPVLDGEYIFYIDHLGYISAVERKSKALQYAYFIRAGMAKGLKNKVDLLLVLDTGEKVALRAGDKVNINGTKNCRDTDILSMTELYDDTGAFLPQLIQVKFDAKGFITEINTAADFTSAKWGFTPNKFSLDLQETNVYWNSARKLFKYLYTVDAETVIFSVPSVFDEDRIYVLKEDQILAINSNLKIYDADETFCAGAVVAEYKPDLNKSFRNAPMVFVTGIRTVCNENNEWVKSITCYYNNEAAVCNFVEERPGIFDSTISDLSVGDMLRLHFSAERKSVIGAERIFSPKKQTTPFNVNYLDGSVSAAEYVDYMGYICGKSDTGISITADNLESIIPFTYYNKYPIIMVYDSAAGELRKGSKEDIPTPPPVMEDGTVSVDTSLPLIYGAKQSGSFYVCYVIK